MQSVSINAELWLRILKSLLLLLFCFLVGRNEDFSYVMILVVIFVLANFSVVCLWAIIGMFFLLISIGLADNIARRITFFLGCGMLLVYLVPYYTDINNLVSYSPSVISFSIFLALLVTTLIVKIILLNKPDGD